MKKGVLLSLVVAWVLCTTILLTAQTICNNETGSQGGYTYEYWKDNGTGCMVLGSGGTFSIDWSNINNLLARKGVRPGSKNVVVNYGANYSPNGNSYLCIYGWTKSPLVEYYIVESWGSWRPPGGEGFKGTVSSDGGTYDIYQTMRYNQPSIEGTQTFPQFWSVRQSKKTSGTVTCANHFDAWARNGMSMGNFYEVSFCVEGYQSSGTANVHTMSMSTGTTPPTSTPTATPTSTPTPTPTGPTPTPNPNPIWTGGPYTLDSSSVNLPAGITSNLYDFSVACWVKLNAVTNWVRIFDFGVDNNVFMMLTPQSGNTGFPYFCITLNGNSGEQGINGTSALPIGSWQHLAVVKSGNTGILYINKQEVARNTSMTLTPAEMGNTSNNFIGKSQWPNDPLLNASVDKFYIYNRGISAAEVAVLGNDIPGGGDKPGDVNGDGDVTITDAMLIAQVTSGQNPPTYTNPANGDVNCDGNVNINDALLIARFSAGLVSSLGGC